MTIGSARFREDGRTPAQLRPATIETNVQKWAEGSCLIKVGGTHVLCSATLEDRIPPHLRGKGTRLGDRRVLDAAPRDLRADAARVRQGPPRRSDARDPATHRPVAARRRRHGQARRADGDRRLRRAQCRRRHADRVDHRRLRGARAGAADSADWSAAVVGQVAAVSVGLVDGAAYLDLDYSEDSRADVDFNVVGTDAGTYVELQGTAEGKPFDRAAMDRLLGAGRRRPAPALRAPGHDARPRSFLGGARPSEGGSSSRRARPTSWPSCASSSTCQASSSSPLDDLGIPGDPVEDGATFADNAIIKARWGVERAALPTLADDSGIEVDALGGGPGVRTRRYAGEHATDDENNAKLLAELAALGACTPDGAAGALRLRAGLPAIPVDPTSRSSPRAPSSAASRPRRGATAASATTPSSSPTSSRPAAGRSAR